MRAHPHVLVLLHVAVRSPRAAPPELAQALYHLGADRSVPRAAGERHDCRHAVVPVAHMVPVAVHAESAVSAVHVRALLCAKLLAGQAESAAAATTAAKSLSRLGGGCRSTFFLSYCY